MNASHADYVFSESRFIQEQQVSPIDRRVYDAGQLMAEHPPKLHHANKQEVYGIACPPGCRHAGRIIYSRWLAMPLPNTVPPPVWPDLVEPREGVFDYVPLAVDGPAVKWHLNFADANLFFGYAEPLFAQDEMQVAEHPTLAAVREALLAEGLKAVTVQNSQPTPVLVSGVQRRCRIRTDANAAEGRPDGLYGNRFGAGSPEAIRRATQAIEPPTVSNILAIAALGYGSGVYTQQQIRHTLQTAYTGFAAARIESAELAGPHVSTIIHTGWWGCGAFGGNKVMMAMLQVLAARLAGVERLVYHTVSRSGRKDLDQALALLDDKIVPCGRSVGLDQAVERLVDMELEWGESNHT